MKSKSSSTVKYLVLLSLAIAISSGYAWQKLSTANELVRRSLPALEKARVEAVEAAAYAASQLTPDATPNRLERTLSATMLSVYNNRTEHRVAITQARVLNAGATSSNSALGQYADKVPGTKLQSVKVVVAGTYAGYQGLLDYLNSIKSTHPVALTYLKVNSTTFEAQMRVYGVL